MHLFINCHTYSVLLLQIKERKCTMRVYSTARWLVICPYFVLKWHRSELRSTTFKQTFWIKFFWFLLYVVCSDVFILSSRFKRGPTYSSIIIVLSRGEEKRGIISKHVCVFVYDLRNRLQLHLVCWAILANWKSFYVLKIALFYKT